MINMVIEYHLYPEDFWRVEQVDWSRATLSDFDTVHFHGDVIFRCAEAIFDYRNIPLLGFAYEFTEMLLQCVREGSAKVWFAFLESDDWMELRMEQGENVWIASSYSAETCIVPLYLLRTALQSANNKLVDEIEMRFPFLMNHCEFQKIVSVLKNV